jgi:RND family efflux transporter MFP subunit
MRPVTQRAGLAPLAIAVRFVAGLVVIGVGAGIFMALAATRADAPRVEHREQETVVRTMTATPVEARRWWEGFGVARAIRASDLAAEVAGVVEERPAAIDAGAWVAAGDLLAALDGEEFRQRLERSESLIRSLEAELVGLRVETESLQETLSLAEEAVTLTRREVERLRDATGRGAATEIELQRLQRDLTGFQQQAEEVRQRLNLIPTREARLEAQIQSERASASLARLDLERCRITAPFDGVLQSIDVNEGERINVGQRVARLVDLRRMEAPLRLPVSAVARLRPGNTVEIEAEGPERRTWTGRIARIAPEAEASTRTATVFVEIEQEPRLDGVDILLPGQFVTARIYAADQRAQLLVPRTAIVGDRLMVIDADGLAQPRAVRVSYHIEAAFPDLVAGETQWAVIEEGLAPGDRVIVSNFQDLEPGSPVRAADEAAEATE